MPKKDKYLEHYHFYIRLDLLDEILPCPGLVVVFQCWGIERKIIYISNVLLLQNKMAKDLGLVD